MATQGAANGPARSDERLTELRELLLGPEHSRLLELYDRLENPDTRARDVSSVLVEAIRLRSNDRKLRKALQPAIEEAISLSVQRNPRMLADALFPILGKAIRKAINAELEGMMRSLSVALEQSASPRSLSWRWEAFRTKRPYAEVVLLRSALYRVEQVFLIHRSTGLLLQHAVWGGVSVKDPEAVAGMLTAIQDFVRDTIGGAAGQDLETVRVGEFSVILAYGTHAILAGFVRGVVPRGLDRVFQDALDSIEQDAGPALASFHGDTASFDTCRPRLQSCLLGQGEPQKAHASQSGARWLVTGIALAVLLALAGWAYVSVRNERRWAALVEQLRSEPGIVVTSAEKKGGRYLITGLQEPLARDARDLIRASGVPTANIESRWEPYHSLAPQFSAQRTYAELKSDVERRAVRFRLGSAEVAPEQHILVEDIAAKILALFRASEAAGKSPRVEVIGNHDPLGSEQSNVALKQSRAVNVLAALIALGVPEGRISVHPHNPAEPLCTASTEEQRLLCRTASFRVIDPSR